MFDRSLRSSSREQPIIYPLFFFPPRADTSKLILEVKLNNGVFRKTTWNFLEYEVYLTIADIKRTFYATPLVTK